MTDEKLIQAIAAIGTAMVGTGPIRVRRTVTNIRTGEVLAMSSWEPGAGGWQTVGPTETIN